MSLWGTRVINTTEMNEWTSTSLDTMIIPTVSCNCDSKINQNKTKNVQTDRASHIAVHNGHGGQCCSALLHAADKHYHISMNNWF